MQPLSPSLAVAKYATRAPKRHQLYFVPAREIWLELSAQSGPLHVNRTVCAPRLEEARPSEPHPLCLHSILLRSSRSLGAQQPSLFPHRCLFISPASLPVRPESSASFSLTHKLWGMSLNISVAHPACRGTGHTFGVKWTRTPVLTRILEQGWTCQNFATNQPIGRQYLLN